MIEPVHPFQRGDLHRLQMSSWSTTLLREIVPDLSIVAVLARTQRLVINLKSAKALGLTIPQSVLLRADDVFE